MHPTLRTIMESAASYLDLALKLLMGVAVVLFVYHVIRLFITPGDSKAHGEASQYVLWSVIGFFVILSFWGIVNILTSTFNLGNNAPSNWTSINDLFPH